MLKLLLGRLANSALDVIFPPRCLGCASEGSFLCDACLADAPRLSQPFCPVCAAPGFVRLCDGCRTERLAVDGIRAPFLYIDDGLIQAAITDLKFRDIRALAPELAQLLADYLAANPMPGELIAPVPSHPSRLRSRGFNQAALLARELGKITGLPVNEELMARTTNAPSQLRMRSRGERLRNVAGNFTCTGRVNGQAVLIVDDLATTGATISACARELTSHGASQVWGLAVARRG